MKSKFKNQKGTGTLKATSVSGGHAIGGVGVKKIDTRRIAITGILAAISIMLSITPLGYIPIGPLNMTVMHLPVIIAAIVEGPIVGATVGLIFGLTSLSRALVAPTIVSFLFINPLVSVLPRVLMGVFSYYIYVFVKKIIKKEKLAAIITGAAGSMLNTAGVLGMIYVLYAERYMEVLNLPGSAGKYLLGIVVSNGIPEAVLAAVVVSAAVVVINKIKK